ncbi:MAG: DUF3817 domain-containing protein [Planctomycetota bacterium]
MGDPLPNLRWTSLAMAASYLLLLAVTLPLKLVYGMRLPSMIGGTVHGVFFMLFVWFAARAFFERGWPAGRLWLLFGASFVPIWPFLLDRHVRRWIAETAR